MGLRFQKRVKIAPGVRVNLSLTRGVSASFGPKGFSHNVGLDGKTRTTVGLPGTGLSHTVHSSSTARRSRAAPQQEASSAPSHPYESNNPVSAGVGRGLLLLTVLMGMVIAVIVLAVYLR